MALFVNQNEQRSELQKKIAAELQQKAKVQPNDPSPDGVEDSKYVENTQQTTSWAWIWIVLIVIVIAIVVVAIIGSAV